MIVSILNVLQIGLNAKGSVPYVLRNQSNSFSFKNGQFYSYNEPISYYGFTEDDKLHIYVYGKTAKYGNYFSMTTSKHIGWLLQQINKNDLLKDNYSIVDINGNVITDKKHKGTKIKELIECPICYDQFNEGTKLICNHKFCNKCIKKWIKNNNSCPYCKTSLYI
jgi:hypothetical protein